MRSTCQIFNHPIHPMMVSLPIGLWVFSFVADILFLVTVREMWAFISAYSMAGGCIGALFAAVPGFIDYLHLVDPNQKKIATWHMITNLILVLLYAVNFFHRYQNGFQVDGMPFIISLLGMIFLTLSGWLGGELVYVHKVAVVEE